MAFLSLYFWILYLITSVLAEIPPYFLPKQKRTCATNHPGEQLRAQHHDFHHTELLDNHLWNSTMIQNHIARSYHPLTHRDLAVSRLRDPYSINKRQAMVDLLYTIDTYLHIVADTANSAPGSVGYVTDKMISDQFAYLTNAYSPTGIAFNLRGVTRTVNDTWARNGDDLAMKTALRRGTYSTLNVYYQTLLQVPSGVQAGEIVFGFCSLPTPNITPTTPPSVYVLDGCNVLSGTLPGSYEEGYNLGGTSIHEIGHWNGLLHPFQDNTCDASNYGDYVADTPQEMTETSGCPELKDTCPSSGVPVGSYNGSSTQTNPYGPAGFSGPDPIHNFMDYSQDSCYEGFTLGQAARMVNLWVIYRMGL